MKYLLLGFIGFLFLASPVQATEVSKELANTYFQNCAKQSDPRFSEETQKLFCACTALNLMKSYTVEDMQASSRQDQIGRNATNKMITQVYAPCIRYPAREYHYQTCIENPKTKLWSDPEAICNCSADQVAVYLERNAQEMLLKIIKKTPNIVDPMQALYDNKEFQEVIQSKVLGCLTQ